MAVYSQDAIEAAAATTRQKYIELAAGATEPRSKLFYEFLAKVSPEVSRWAMANGERSDPMPVVEAFVKGMGALYCVMAHNLYREGESVQAALNMIAGTARCIPDLMGNATPGVIVKKLDS